MMKPSKNCIVHIKGSNTNSVLSEEETASTDSLFSFFPTSAAKYRIRDLHLLMQNVCQALFIGVYTFTTKMDFSC